MPLSDVGTGLPASFTTKTESTPPSPMTIVVPPSATLEPLSPTTMKLRSGVVPEVRVTARYS